MAPELKTHRSRKRDDGEAELGAPTTQLPKAVIIGGGESCIVQLPELPRTPRHPSAPWGPPIRPLVASDANYLETWNVSFGKECRTLGLPAYPGVQAAGRAGGLVDGQVC